MSLGKGAWDCDSNTAIPPEKEVTGLHFERFSTVLQTILTSIAAQAEVFEEIATMDFPFEGIPTVPPRKDMQHMVSWAKCGYTWSGNFCRL